MRVMTVSTRSSQVIVIPSRRCTRHNAPSPASLAVIIPFTGAVSSISVCETPVAG